MRMSRNKKHTAFRCQLIKRHETQWHVHKYRVQTRTQTHANCTDMMKYFLSKMLSSEQYSEKCDAKPTTVWHIHKYWYTTYNTPVSIPKYPDVSENHTFLGRFCQIEIQTSGLVNRTINNLLTARARIFIDLVYLHPWVSHEDVKCWQHFHPQHQTAFIKPHESIPLIQHTGVETSSGFSTAESAFPVRDSNFCRFRSDSRGTLHSQKSNEETASLGKSIRLRHAVLMSYYISEQ